MQKIKKIITINPFHRCRPTTQQTFDWSFQRCFYQDNYWSIIVGRGGSMFVDFVGGYPFPRIYVPTNVEETNKLPCIEMQQTSYPRNNALQRASKIWTTLAPTNKKDPAVWYFIQETIVIQFTKKELISLSLCKYIINRRITKRENVYNILTKRQLLTSNLQLIKLRVHFQYKVIDVNISSILLLHCSKLILQKLNRQSWK